MKKDKILKSSLSTLMKRFSNTDLISSISSEQTLTTPKSLSLSLIKDNSILKRARINEKLLDKVINNINEKGIHSPLYVYQKEGYYEVIYPRILFIAAKKMKLDSVPCVLITLTEDDILLFLAAKLQQTRDSNIVETSLLFNSIKKKLKYSQKEIALAMDLSRSQVTNIMRLIKLPDYVLNDISNGKLSFGHVRALSTLKDEEKEEIINRIYEENLSVHDVEKIVYQKKHKVDFIKDENKLQKKYKCNINSSSKRVSFIFDNEKEKEKFIKSLLNK